MKKQLRNYLSLFLLVILVKSISAQTLEMSMVPDSVSTFEFDYARLLLSDSDQSFISGNFNLEYQHVLNSKFNLIAEVPISHFGFNGNSETNIGNLYLGAQLKTQSSESVNSALNFGVYVPSASESITNGLVTNFFDYIEYIDEVTGVRLSYNSFHFLDGDFRLGYELGTDLAIPVGDLLEDPELFGKYGVSMMYGANSDFYVQAELLGIAILTEDGDFDENTIHTYGIGLGYNFNNMGVGLYYRNYFDEMFGDEFKGVLGIKVNTNFN